MVIDRAAVLDENQERSAINDAWRLTTTGTPTQVVTENVALDQSQADARADELRISHGIESARGADDGILLYLSEDPNNSDSTVMSVSSGRNALPNNGLNADSIGRVMQDIAGLQLAEGKPARAIVYSLREIIYLQQYAPPAASEVTGASATVQKVLAWLAPLAALATGAWILSGYWNEPKRPRTVFFPAIVGALISGVLVLLAVLSHSTIGVHSGLALGGTVIWLAIRLDGVEIRSPRRAITVTPRPRLLPTQAKRGTAQ